MNILTSILALLIQQSLNTPTPAPNPGNPIPADSAKVEIFGPALEEVAVQLVPEDLPVIGSYCDLNLISQVDAESFGMLFFAFDRVELENQWGMILVLPELVLNPILTINGDEALTQGVLPGKAVGAMTFHLPDWDGLQGQTVHCQFVGTFPVMPGSATYSNGVSWTFGK